MTTPALVVAGDRDTSARLTVAGPAWHTDPYHLAPSPKSLLTLTEAEHGLGGISGYAAAETTNESPERVRAVAQLTSAYLRTQLGLDPTSWPTAQQTLAAAPTPLGHVTTK